MLGTELRYSSLTHYYYFLHNSNRIFENIVWFVLLVMGPIPGQGSQRANHHYEILANQGSDLQNNKTTKQQTLTNEMAENPFVTRE